MVLKDGLCVFVCVLGHARACMFVLISADCKVAISHYRPKNSFSKMYAGVMQITFPKVKDSAEALGDTKCTGLKGYCCPRVMAKCYKKDLQAARCNSPQK